MNNRCERAYTSYTNVGKEMNTINNSVLRRVPYYNSYDILTVLSANVRGITIQQIFEHNNVNGICVTEILLSSDVTNSSIAIQGYSLFRKDRVTKQGGVCIYF